MSKTDTKLGKLHKTRNGWDIVYAGVDFTGCFHDDIRIPLMKKDYPTKSMDLSELVEFEIIGKFARLVSASDDSQDIHESINREETWKDIIDKYWTIPLNDRIRLVDWLEQNFHTPLPKNND